MHMNGKKWLRIKQVAEFLGISVPTAWRWVAAGKLPAGVKFGERTTVWDSEIVFSYAETLVQKAKEELKEKAAKAKAEAVATEPVQKMKSKRTTKTNKTTTPQPGQESVSPNFSH